MNGCNIVGIYNVAGGVSNFSMTMRIVEKTGYRDLKMDCNNLNADPNTYHQVLYYDQQAYRRTQQPLYHETVGGLGLGMSEQDVKAKYGILMLHIPILPWCIKVNFKQTSQMTY